ncbi:hypothetical protein [Pseudoalteromonas sp. meg-B1]|uniref:hypothetical protein n=1 Tax=Pseudoalteromonas sp. meg-B1 TaxID=2203192 RepID=UPI0015E8658C|nr:hypothetical protein [Pseudoalteromonas sp. meg-B1]
MNVTTPTAPKPLEQLNKVNTVQDNPEQSKQDFAALLNDEVSIQNGGGGHPLNPKRPK